MGRDTQKGDLIRVFIRPPDGGNPRWVEAVVLSYDYEWDYMKAQTQEESGHRIINIARRATYWRWPRVQEISNTEVAQDPAHKICVHDWVNISFMHIRMVCKHCNQEQT